jgi:hypothetical protein
VVCEFNHHLFISLSSRLFFPESWFDDFDCRLATVESLSYPEVTEAVLLKEDYIFLNDVNQSYTLESVKLTDSYLSRKRNPPLVEQLQSLLDKTSSPRSPSPQVLKLIDIITPRFRPEDRKE